MRVESHSAISAGIFSGVLRGLKILDWKVYTCFAVVMGAIVLLAVRHMQNATPKILRVTLEDLDFESNVLDITAYMKEELMIFHEVARKTLKAIQKGVTPNSSIVVIDPDHSPHILDFVNIGLPIGKSYDTVSEAQQKQSWVHQILTRLREKKYIVRFKIEKTITLNI